MKQEQVMTYVIIFGFVAFTLLLLREALRWIQYGWHSYVQNQAQQLSQRPMGHSQGGVGEDEYEDDYIEEESDRQTRSTKSRRRGASPEAAGVHRRGRAY